jgi:hypothetical protein
MEADRKKLKWLNKKVMEVDSSPEKKLFIVWFFPWDS